MDYELERRAVSALYGKQISQAGFATPWELGATEGGGTY